MAGSEIRAETEGRTLMRRLDPDLQPLIAIGT